MADYPLLPIHPDFRGPAGTEGQIQVDGLVEKIKLFHGIVDEELDWHIYFSLDPDAAQAIGAHLRRNNESISDETLESSLYSELMIIDRWRRRGLGWKFWETFQRRYESADLTRPLRLEKPGSAHPAWDLGKQAADDTGTNHDFSQWSRLKSERGRIYMQGLFVKDMGHTPPRVEIHPPDSIAFAMNEGRRTLAMKGEDPDWPDRLVRWRVAWFANSAHHRVSDEAYLQQERTTTWYLDLPGDAVRDNPFQPGLFVSIEIKTEPIMLWNSASAEGFSEWYDMRGVCSIDSAEIAIDPRDNQRKLRVSATMCKPLKRGGLVVRDYVLRVKPQVVTPI